MDENPEDAPPGDGPGVNMRAMETWDLVVEDMEATAAELEDAGWQTLQVHPGDVTVLTDVAEPGIDAVLPNPEFAALEALVDEGVRFGEYEAFRAGNRDVEFALLVAKDPAAQVAVLVPLYYRVMDLAQAASGRETIAIYLRQLTEESIQLDLENPDLLLPDDE